MLIGKALEAALRPGAEFEAFRLESGQNPSPISGPETLLRNIVYYETKGMTSDPVLVSSTTDPLCPKQTEAITGCWLSLRS